MCLSLWVIRALYSIYQFARLHAGVLDRKSFREWVSRYERSAARELRCASMGTGRYRFLVGFFFGIGGVGLLLRRLDDDGNVLLVLRVKTWCEYSCFASNLLNVWP